MELTRSRVDRAADEYAAAQPLYAVEAEHRELLPGTLRGGEYGWRDVEWVVRWYYRRLLGAYPDDERREAEDAFRDNDFEAVLDAVAAAVEADETRARLDALTALAGVDVPVASAFLQFLFPDRYVVVGEREWAVLRATGVLEAAYPDPPTAAHYERYLDRCRTLADRFDCDLWTLYRALWVLGSRRDAGG